MSLSIGELAGYLGLDTGPFDKAVAGTEKSLGKISKFAITAGATAGAALAKGLADTLDIGAANDKLAAQLGLTEQQSEAYGRAAGKLYADAYGDSLDDVNAAVAAVSSTFGDNMGPAEDALETLSAKALDFAAVFDIDVNRAVNSAGILLRSGLARDANHAFDLIVTASQKVPAHLREDVLDAADEYSQFFAALGISGEQAFGMLVAASQDGVYEIDKTGDALKELTIRATDMSTASVAAYEAAGLNAEEMAAKFVAGGDTARGALDELVRGLLAIEDPVARSNAAIGLFGTPLEDLSVSEIPQFLQSLADMGDGLGDVGGAAERMGETLNSNAKTEIEAFKRQALQKLSDFVADKVIPTVRDFAKFVKSDVVPAVRSVTGFVKNNETAFKTLAVALGALFALQKTHAAFVAIQAAGGLIKYLAQMNLVQAATKTWTAVQWLLNAAMSANPVLLVVAGIAALVAALVLAWQHSETFREIVTGAFDKVKQIAEAVFGWIRDNWPLLLAILTGPFGLAVLAIVRHWGDIKGAATGAKDWIKARIDDIAGFVTGLPGRISGAASQFLQSGKELGSALLQGISDAVGEGVSFAADIASAIGGAIHSFIDDKVLGALRTALLTMARTLASVNIPGVGRGFDAASRTIEGIVERLHLPALAAGAFVKARAGGMLALIAEGGEDEAVLPLSKLTAMLDRSFHSGMSSAVDGTAGTRSGQPQLPIRGGDTIFQFPNYIGSQSELRREMRAAEAHRRATLVAPGV
jgi:phage-related minor tail protein